MSSTAPARAGKSASLLVTCLLAAAVMLIDGFDLQLMGVLVPPLASSWGVPPQDFSMALTASVVGLGVGAAFIAPLGDLYGRRTLILAAFALLGFAVLGSAFAADPMQLSVWRLLTGIGLGATLPNTAALVAELAPDRNRAGLLTLIGLPIAIGAMASGLAVRPMLAIWGWQGPFLASAAVTAIVWLLLLWKLPESSRRATTRTGKSVDWSSLLAILGPDHRLGTLLVWLLFAGNAFLLYMLASWVPTLLAARGWSIGAAAEAIAYMQGGGLIGGLVIAALMDRWRPGFALVGGYAVAAFGLAAFSVIPASPFVWGLLIALAGAGISGVHMTLNAVAASVYPAHILSAGIGFTVAIARIGAICGPIAGGALIAGGISAETFLALLLAPVLLCAICALALPMRRRAAGA